MKTNMTMAKNNHEWVDVPPEKMVLEEILILRIFQDTRGTFPRPRGMRQGMLGFSEINASSSNFAFIINLINLINLIHHPIHRCKNSSTPVSIFSMTTRWPPSTSRSFHVLGLPGSRWKPTAKPNRKMKNQFLGHDWFLWCAKMLFLMGNE